MKFANVPRSPARPSIRPALQWVASIVSTGPSGPAALQHADHQAADQQDLEQLPGIAGFRVCVRRSDAQPRIQQLDPGHEQVGQKSRDQSDGRAEKGEDGHAADQ